MKSEFKKLLKSDYFEIFYETLMWAVIGYVLPVLNGDAVLNLTSLYAALGAGVVMGVKKAVKLYLTNSAGKFLRKEPSEVIIP